MAEKKVGVFEWWRRSDFLPQIPLPPQWTEEQKAAIAWRARKRREEARRSLAAKPQMPPKIERQKDY